MSIFLWVFFSKSAIAQDSKFESLKFYGMPYYSETHNRIDRYSIVVYGDSVHIKDKIMIQEFQDMVTIQVNKHIFNHGFAPTFE